jgi:hypothetical protein
MIVVGMPFPEKMGLSEYPPPIIFLKKISK